MCVSGTGLINLPNFKELRCGYNENFTDDLLINLPNLTHFYCECNFNFTNQVLHYLSMLKKIGIIPYSGITEYYIKEYFPSIEVEVADPNIQ